MIHISGRHDDEVVAVDDFVGARRREVGRAAAGHRRATALSRSGSDPWRTPRRRGRRSRPPRRPRTCRDLDHAGRQQRHAAFAAAPAGHRRRPRPCPAEPDGERDPQLAGRQPRSRGSTTVPTPARRRRASGSTPARSAAAITARTPDQAAILAAAIFDAMPPLPRADAGAAGHASSSGRPRRSPR